ncbi:TIM barrel protein [Candidatus Woesearchaeota archaeon]|nr:TIM barrel protein [Candidatus Woesearchaeota archaeon]
MIRLGPAGNIEQHDTISTLQKLKNMGLQAKEIEFVRQVYLKNDAAKIIGKKAKELDINLSIHAPYFINLASEEKDKVIASKKRILDSCERGHFLGATHVVFHPAYFGKRSKEETYSIVKNEIMDMLETINRSGWNVKLAPETTGKHSAFGSLDEIIKIVKETKCDICIDPAHLYARNNGTINFKEMLDKLEVLKLKNLHFHFSAIKYSPKGEVSHLTLAEGGPKFEPFASELLKRKIDCTIISESPITWQDSLNMKKILEKLGYKF